MSKFLGETSTPELIRLIKQDLSTKQDLIESPTQDNLAATDSSGQTIDSGISSDLIKNNLSDTDRYTDQCFLYRESLADNDGIAKIDKIKGNSLVFNQKVWSEGEAEINSIKGNTVSFNQLVQNGNFSDGLTNWSGSNGTMSVVSGMGRLTFQGDAWNNDFRQTINGLIGNHKYFVCINIRASEALTNRRIFVGGFSGTNIGIAMQITVGTNLTYSSAIFTCPNDITSKIVRITPESDASSWSGEYYEFTNFMIFDLTLMGIDNLTTAEEVEAWLSTHIGNQPYYDYTPGTLVSFNGTGLKTTGKNLLDTSSWIINNNLHVISIQGFPNTKYTIQSNIPLSIGGSNQGTVYFCNSTESPSLGSNATYEGKTITTTTNADGILNIYYHDRNYITNWGDWNIMLQIGEIATSYEPYTSNVLWLPTQSFNIWDEQWELGAYSYTTGEKQTDSTRIRCKNMIRVISGTTYNTNKPLTYLEYDADGNFTGYYAYLSNGGSFTANANVQYITFYATATYGTTYNNDICINISDSSVNGTYRPHITPYFPFGEMSAGTVYDELTENNCYKRIGVVDLGNLDYIYDSTYQRFYCGNPSSNIKFLGNRLTPLISAIYECKWHNEEFDTNWNMVIYSSGSSGIYIHNHSYTDASTFKTAMQGVYLLYELTTPLVNYGVVDLGSLTWLYDSANSRFKSNALTDAKAPADTTTLPNAICSKFATVAYTGLSADDSFTIIFESSASKGEVWIKDTSYTDATAFKTAMSGVYLLYELATPVAPSLDLSYPVYVNGTEQLIPQNGIVPVTSSLKANIDYPYGVQETEFIYNQTLRNIVLTSGHSYITKVNGTWNNVTGTGQTLTVGDDDMVIDLTQMANPYITNYSQFTALYPDHYDFEKGRLISFTGAGLKTVGFNQWDEEWELGYYSTSTGEKKSATTQIRCKNKISVLPNTKYYFYSSNDDSTKWALFFDQNEELIKGYSTGKTTSANASSIGNYEFTTPLNCAYMVFYCTNSYGTTYNNQMCINLFDTNFNGTYKPYTTNTLSLPTSTRFPTGMKSVGSVYDELTSSKAYTRTNKVSLNGSENWITSGTNGYAITSINSGITDCVNESSSNTQCESNLFVRSGTTWSNGFFGIENRTIWIGDTNFAKFGSLENFKTYLSNNPLVIYYPLATPTETDVSLNLNYIAWKGGTEEILSDSEEVPPTSPFVGDLSYLGTKDTILSYNDIILDLDNKVDSIQTIYYGDSTIID